MAKYFKNIKSYEDLKTQFKELLKVNHPDNGGDVSVMQEINAEYDALFRIWKNRHEKDTGASVNETADSTRSMFYTEFGFKGKNHDWNRSLKEVAAIVRSYVKEKYPTYKFSVRTSYASMCQELHVDLKESPVEIYKSFDELTESDKYDLMRKMRHNYLFELNCWNDEELKAEFERIWKEHGNFYRCLNEITSTVISDVDSFVRSYNYEDCDSMIDYHHVDFYYFGCAENNGINIKVVPRTPRIKKQNNAPSERKVRKAQKVDSVDCIEGKIGYTFDVLEDTDTRDGSTVWIVKVRENLCREEYLRINKAMQKIGGYYSRFKHGFLFRTEPTQLLKDVA